MPGERITNSCYFIILLSSVHGRHVEISIDIQKGDLPLKSLLNLVQVNLNDGKGVINCEIERFSSCDLIEFDHFRVGRLHNRNNI